MFNVGVGELLVILLIALIVLGPDKLPDAARKLGNVMGELRRMSRRLPGRDARSTVSNLTKVPSDVATDNAETDTPPERREPAA